MIGQTIDGKYLIKKMLGEGGMGAVYEAEHTSTGRRCAVKVISSEELTQDPQVVSRFQREARAAGRIDTQHITQVLDAGVDRDSGMPFLAMEYMEGEDLQALSKRCGALSPDLVLRVAAQACLGLQKAHDAKVVHRDIKPHNLYLAVRDAGEIVVKLLDFGIAKVKMDQAQSADGADLTKTGNLLGSPLYVSPEQARGKKSIDHRTDIWSLGAVMYQGMTGRTPYQHATALGELILMVCTEDPPPIQEFAPWVQPEHAAIVHKCLQKDPANRYQSAKEMFDAIGEQLDGGWGIQESMCISLEESQREIEAERLPPEAVSAGSAPASTTTGAAAAITAAGSTMPAGPNGASTTGPLAATTAEPEEEGSKFGMIAVAVAVMGLAGAGVFWASQDDPPPPAPTVAAQPPPPPPAPTPKPAAAPPPPKPAPAKKVRVRVVILPDTAKVFVEDQPAKVKGGLLEIEGLLGSIHRVKVVKGTGESTADVVVTESGALPPKIEVKVGKKLFIDKSGKAAATSKPKAAPAKGLPQGVDHSMDEFK